jgi:hypothetical protein
MLTHPILVSLILVICDIKVKITSISGRGGPAGGFGTNSQSKWNYAVTGRLGSNAAASIGWPGTTKI